MEMSLLMEIVLLFLLIATCHTTAYELKKKSSDGLKRAVETYTYQSPTEKLDENQENFKSKVIVETIKSISPSEYLSSTVYLGNPIESTTTSGKTPLGSITYNVYEPDTAKKETSVSLISTESASPLKKKSSHKYYTGSITSNSQKPTSSLSTTVQPSPEHTTSVELASNGFQYSTHSSVFSPSGSTEESSEKQLKIVTSRGKPSNGRYTIQKIIKKPVKAEAKFSDSKPEETGFNSYHYDVGSLSFETKHSSSQNSGMMGASYMRSSSPFYNYHVMLD